MKLALLLQRSSIPFAVMLAGAIFLADVSLPLGVAGGVPYVLVIFFGWYFPWSGAILVLAAAASILTVAGYLYSPEGGIPWMVNANRGLALLAIWGTAIPLALAKMTQEALRESAERYANLYNHTPAMLYSIDDQGRLINVSDYWLKEMGYERDEVIGRMSVDFLTEDSRHYALEGSLPAFIKSGRASDVPYRFVKKNGEIIDTLLSAVMETGAEDTPLHSLTVVTDVTERKRAEEALRTAYDDLERRVIERTQELTDTITELRHTEAALRDSEERFRAGFEHAAVGLAMVDAKGRYQLVNPALCQFLGYTELELLTLDRILITHPDDRQASTIALQGLWGETQTAREKRNTTSTKMGTWCGVTSPSL